MRVALRISVVAASYIIYYLPFWTSNSASRRRQRWLVFRCGWSVTQRPFVRGTT
jgi:hypothetical protein